MVNSKEIYDQVKKYQHHKLILKPKKSALLVIDMQNDFLNPKSPAYTENAIAIVPNIQSLIEAARKHKIPVIYTAHCHQNPKIDGGITAQWWSDIRNQETLVAGTQGAQIIDTLKPLPKEKIIYKHRYSAFYNTDLELHLRGLGVTDLLIIGIMTGICVESPVRDAFYRDFRIFVVGDATAAGADELHLNSLKILAYAFADIRLTKDIIRIIT